MAIKIELKTIIKCGEVMNLIRDVTNLIQEKHYIELDDDVKAEIARIILDSSTLKPIKRENK